MRLLRIALVPLLLLLAAAAAVAAAAPKKLDRRQIAEVADLVALYEFTTMADLTDPSRAPLSAYLLGRGRGGRLRRALARSPPPPSPADLAYYHGWLRAWVARAAARDEWAVLARALRAMGERGAPAPAAVVDDFLGRAPWYQSRAMMEALAALRHRLPAAAGGDAFLAAVFGVVHDRAGCLTPDLVRFATALLGGGGGSVAALEAAVAVVPARSVAFRLFREPLARLRPSALADLQRRLAPPRLAPSDWARLFAGVLAPRAAPAPADGDGALARALLTERLMASDDLWDDLIGFFLTDDRCRPPPPAVAAWAATAPGADARRLLRDVLGHEPDTALLALLRRVAEQVACVAPDRWAGTTRTVAPRMELSEFLFALADHLLGRVRAADAAIVLRFLRGIAADALQLDGVGARAWVVDVLLGSAAAAAGPVAPIRRLLAHIADPAASGGVRRRNLFVLALDLVADAAGLYAAMYADDLCLDVIADEPHAVSPAAAVAFVSAADPVRILRHDALRRLFLDAFDPSDRTVAAGAVVVVDGDDGGSGLSVESVVAALGRIRPAAPSPVADLVGAVVRARALSQRRAAYLELVADGLRAAANLAFRDVLAGIVVRDPDLLQAGRFFVANHPDVLVRYLSDRRHVPVWAARTMPWLALAAVRLRLADSGQAAMAAVLAPFGDDALLGLVAALFSPAAAASLPADFADDFAPLALTCVVERGVAGVLDRMLQGGGDDFGTFRVRIGAWLGWLRGRRGLRVERGPLAGATRFAAADGTLRRTAAWLQAHLPRISRHWRDAVADAVGTDARLAGLVPLAALAVDDFAFLVRRCRTSPPDAHGGVVRELGEYFALHPDELDDAAVADHVATLPAASLRRLRQSLPPVVAQRFAAGFLSRYGGGGGGDPLAFLVDVPNPVAGAETDCFVCYRDPIAPAGQPAAKLLPCCRQSICPACALYVSRDSLTIRCPFCRHEVDCVGARCLEPMLQAFLPDAVLARR